MPKVDLSVSGYGPVNSSQHGGYGAGSGMMSGSHGAIGSMGHQHSRYSHQGHYYSTYDMRRSSPGHRSSFTYMSSNSPFGSSGSGNNGPSQQIWASGALGAHVTQGSSSIDIPALAALGNSLGLGNASQTNQTGNALVSQGGPM